ncbi:MAG: FHA domain-containing protein [Clostridiales Family XIII bacterium]|jgi:hypothetical protein|nr:FHA domain-containing protein [Clostridiales Family XIII bacterium]
MEDLLYEALLDSYGSSYGGYGDYGLYGDSVFGDIFGALAGTAVIGVGYIIFWIALAAVLYAYAGWVLLHIGRKAGVKGCDWMAFVPFCRSVYGLKILGEPWWKMFWFENYMFFAGLALFIGILASGGLGAGFVILCVIVVAYVFFGIIYGILYHMKLYPIFGINPLLALLYVLPGWINGICMVVESLLAFSSNFQAVGNRAQAIASSPINQLRNDFVGGAAKGSVTGLSGMYAGATIDVAAGDELVIGRDPVLANLIISDNADKISRRHCGIIFDGARYSVTDYSSNGTFKADGTRLMANIPTAMPRGSEIILGSKQLSFRLN